MRKVNINQAQSFFSNKKRGLSLSLQKFKKKSNHEIVQLNEENNSIQPCNKENIFKKIRFRKIITLRDQDQQGKIGLILYQVTTQKEIQLILNLFAKKQTKILNLVEIKKQLTNKFFLQPSSVQLTKIYNQKININDHERILCIKSFNNTNQISKKVQINDNVSKCLQNSLNQSYNYNNQNSFIEFKSHNSLFNSANYQRKILRQQKAINKIDSCINYFQNVNLKMQPIDNLSKTKRILRKIQNIYPENKYDQIKVIRPINKSNKLQNHFSHYEKIQNIQLNKNTLEQPIIKEPKSFIEINNPPVTFQKLFCLNDKQNNPKIDHSFAQVKLKQIQKELNNILRQANNAKQYFVNI